MPRFSGPRPKLINTYRTKSYAQFWLIRFLRTLAAGERRHAEASQATLPRHLSLPERMAGSSPLRGREPTETRPKRPCSGSLPLCGLQHDNRRILYGHRTATTRTWRSACSESGLFGVPRLHGLKPPEGGIPSGVLDLHLPDQDGRSSRYAQAYPPAGGVKATNSRPKAGILVR